MAISTCPKCNHSNFETQETSPNKSNFKLIFVQCSACGCVVGVMEYYNIGARISELEKKIDCIANEVHDLQSVNNNLNIINTNILTVLRDLKKLK
jgi:hypothetical protein